MKKLALLVALVPAVALAQGAPAPSPEARPGPHKPSPEAMQRMQKRMQLALTLGLAEALDLNATQALKVHDQLEKMTPRRMALHQQLRDGLQALRRSAKGEKVAAGEVDQAVTKLLDGRAQLQALDREFVTTVTKDQPPEKKARAVLFLARFHRRAMQGFGGMHHGGHGMMGPGDHGHGDHGMGPHHGGEGHGGDDAGPLGMAGEGWEGGDADEP